MQVYPKKEYLQNYVLIGLPAPESSNPLLLPLAGHELGHPLWHTQNLGDFFYNLAAAEIITTILAEVESFRDVYSGEIGSTEITKEYLIDNLRLFSTAISSLNSHAEETFCDFVGLKIFGYSYLKAFSYMASPRLAMQRVEEYPRLTSRVRNLLDVADRFQVEAPAGYVDLFEDDPDPEYQGSMEYNLRLADTSLNGMTKDLADRADALLRRARVPEPSEPEAKRILNRFTHIVPAENARSLADILNAAWMAFEDENLWAEIPDVHSKRERAIKEIVLKNIELFEIEQRQKE